MKIASLSCVYPPYKAGIATVAKEQVDIFRALGHSVTVFALNKNNTHSNEHTDVRWLSPVISYGNAGVPFTLLTALEEFDLIWLHYPFVGVDELIYILSMIRETRFMMYYHMALHISGVKGKIINAWERAICDKLSSRAEHVFVSSFDYVRTTNYAPRMSRNFVEMPLAVSTTMFAPPHVKPVTSRPNILFVGALDSAHYFKGVDVLLRACANLSIKKQEFSLTIVGGGNLRAGYETMAHDLGIAPHTQFLGSVPNGTLINSYKAADIMVLPSINSGEAFGMVLLEAMSSGVPVIASNLPGVRTVVDSESGILVKPGDVGSLTNALSELLTNSERRIYMGSAARSRALRYYDITQHAKLLEHYIR